MAMNNENKASQLDAGGIAPRIHKGAVTETTHATDHDEVERDDSLAEGDVAGEYIIEQKIGWGGCSTVYSARHHSTGQRVAVKVMHPGLAESPKQVQRFVQEARAVRLIKHATIVEVFDIGRLSDGRPYIVMELLEGVNLASLIQTRGRFSPPEALAILEPIVEALAMAHDIGIVHRDIKASNIVIVEDGDNRQVKLLDFGIAKLVNMQSGSMQTTIGHVLGTPHSMAPEQIKGLPIDGRTDVYALGALLFRLLTGKHPFEGTDAMTLTRMHVHTPPPPPSQSAPVSPAIDAVVKRALEKEPNNRYASVLEFIEAMRNAAGTRPTSNEERARALGIYVEARVEAGSETDDELLDDLMNIIEITEAMFDEHEICVPLQTGNAILGAVLVPSPGAEEDVRNRIMDIAALLDDELSARLDADDRISINVCLHLADVDVRAVAGREEIIGGPLVDVGSWAPQQSIEGVCATPETLGFALEDRDRNSRSYVRIGSRRISSIS